MAFYAGQTITAAFLDRLENPPIAALTQTVAQSLTNSTWTAITFTAEDVDSYGGHSTTSNTSRYVSQLTGWYTVNAVIVFSPNSSGFRAARLLVNGVAATETVAYVPNNSSAESVAVTPTRDIYLNSGDYVEAAGWQNSGGSLNTSVSGLNSGLWARYSHA